MILRRYHAIGIVAVLLLSAAVMPASWDVSRTLHPPQMPDAPEIALTFDDGPHDKYTQRLLELLKRENVRATFFVVGKMALRRPDLLQSIAADGHEIANHSFNHPNLKRLDRKAILEELDNTRILIQHLTGRNTWLYRPPGGMYNRGVEHVAADSGYKMILWDVQTADVRLRKAAKVGARIITRCHDGSIVLMHSGVPETMQILPDVIETLRRRGYRFVTVSEMLEKQARGKS